MKVSPRHDGDRCQYRTRLDPAGRPTRCYRDATMRLDDTPCCDRHAEGIMDGACGRRVKIERTRA